MKVSVIVPTHNRAELLRQTLDNLLAQSLPPRQVIVVDDGSTDATPEVLNSYGAAVTALRQENRGAAAARNRGLREATGEFIQFMDSDDLCSLNKLEAQARALTASSADICLSPWAKVRIAHGQIQFEDHVLQQMLPAARLSPAAWLVRGWSTVLQSLLWRRSFLERIGSLREDLVTNDDIELFWRALSAGATLTFAPEALTLYRVHEADKLSASPRWHASRLRDWSVLVDQMRRDVRAGSVKIDFLSQVYLNVDWAETWRHLENAGEGICAPETEKPSLWRRRGARLFRRGCEIAGGIRSRLRGARWMAGYHSTPPTLEQRALARAVERRLA